MEPKKKKPFDPNNTDPVSIKVTNPQNVFLLKSLIAQGQAKTMDGAVNLICKEFLTASMPKNLIAERDKLKTENEALALQVKELTEKQPEKETVTETIEVEKPLTGNQFIMEPAEPTAKAMRKVRKFAKENAVVAADIKNEDYPAAITEVALKYYLNNEFSQYI